MTIPEELLTRIADALERIADALEGEVIDLADFGESPARAARRELEGKT